MRIASTQYHSTMNTALQNASSRLEKIMQQMASGQKLQVPSDDPITNVRLSRLTREEAALTQYRDNISALSSRLQQNETQLSGMSNDLLNARDLLVWAANGGGNTAEDMVAMAGSLESLRDGLFYSANSRDQEGRFLFSGTATGTSTVTYDASQPAGARYTFTGNTASQKVVVGNGVTQTANVTLEEMATFLNELDSTIAVLQAPGMVPTSAAVMGQVRAGIDGLDAALSSISGKIAGLGGAQNILATLETNHANVSLSNKQATLTLGQLDYSDAAVKLNGYTNALQATQQAYAKVSKLSLFDVL